MPDSHESIRSQPDSPDRFRRQSGDDKHRFSNVILDAFRPRSKSDSKSKRPTFMSSLRSSMGSGSRSTVVSPTSPLATYSIPPAPHRPRSGSDSKGTVSKMIDMLRHRSQSMTSDLKSKLGTSSSSSFSSDAKTGNQVGVKIFYAKMSCRKEGEAVFLLSRERTDCF